MTISYAGNFGSLLFRWRGSLWRAVWKELALFLILYYLIRLLYNFGLGEDAQDTFEKVSIMFNHYTQLIPLTFLLGFYVASVVARWWQQFQFVAWPDDLLSIICFAIPGSDDESRLKRHQLGRWLCLTCALGWRDVSVKVRQRFPSVETLVQAGLMTQLELDLYNSVPQGNVRWQLPLQWTQKLIRRELEGGRIPPPVAGALVKEIATYRASFRKLYCYDWVCIPLVYTQVTAVATYGYFLFCLIGRQTLNVSKGFKNSDVDIFFPVFTTLQFLFYIGWFKVGQELMRPFGTDDDDIELNYILNRHVKAVFAMANDVNEQEPPLQEDKFWNVKNVVIGHTYLSSQLREHPPKLHAKVTIRNEKESEFTDDLKPLSDRRQKRIDKKSHREF